MSELANKTLRRFVEMEISECDMPEPSKIAELAQAVEPAPRQLCASDYGEAINVLRDKGYTWKEISEWFGQQGVEYSMQAITAGWRTWKIRSTSGF